jgi:hypothetical protein
MRLTEGAPDLRGSVKACGVCALTGFRRYEFDDAPGGFAHVELFYPEPLCGLL